MLLTSVFFSNNLIYVIFQLVRGLGYCSWV